MPYKFGLILVYSGLLTIVKGVKDVDGGYTEWSEWSRCTANCDVTTGHQSQSRTCTNPKPEGNGRTCEEQGLGPTYRWKECSLRPLSCVSIPILLFALIAIWCTAICLCVSVYCYCTCSKRRQRRRAIARSLASSEPPHYSVERVRSSHLSPFQRPGSTSEMLQMAFLMTNNEQSTSHPQAPTTVCVTNTTELQAPAGSPREVGMMELPPLRLGEETPPPYPREQPPPPYSREQPPPPYRLEQSPTQCPPRYPEE